MRGILGLTHLLCSCFAHSASTSDQADGSSLIGILSPDIHGVGAEGFAETHATCRQGIEMRGVNLLVSRAAEHFGGLIVDENQDYVGFAHR